MNKEAQASENLSRNEVKFKLQCIAQVQAIPEVFRIKDFDCSMESNKNGRYGEIDVKSGFIQRPDHHASDFIS
jgi:hypothetical protein